MELIEAIEKRHSVRSFLNREIEPEKADLLQCAIDEYNREGGLHIQLCLNESAAFDNILARYGVFENVNNYLALVGPKGDGFEVKCGYYGQKLVLLAQQLGLRTCWVGGTYSKRKSVANIARGEKLYLVIALGYGENDGKPRRSKPMEELCRFEGEGDLPDWFFKAMEAAMLAPTAINQQKFLFTLEGDSVKSETRSGFYSKVDLGIAQCNFEIGAEAAGAEKGIDWHWAGQGAAS